MSSHESFWVATAAAAPVIALAYVVALPDTGNLLFIARANSEVALKLKKDPDPDNPISVSKMEFARMSLKAMLVIWYTSLANVLIQAVLLGVSLWALAYGHDEIPPWSVIFLAVGGIIFLAYTKLLANTFPDSMKNGLLPGRRR
jgi:hypothetical protein